MRMSRIDALSGQETTAVQSDNGEVAERKRPSSSFYLSAENDATVQYLYDMNTPSSSTISASRDSANAEQHRERMVALITDEWPNRRRHALRAHGLLLRDLHAGPQRLVTLVQDIEDRISRLNKRWLKLPGNIEDVVSELRSVYVDPKIMLHGGSSSQQPSASPSPSPSSRSLLDCLPVTEQEILENYQEIEQRLKVWNQLIKQQRSQIHLFGTKLQQMLIQCDTHRSNAQRTMQKFDEEKDGVQIHMHELVEKIKTIDDQLAKHRSSSSSSNRNRNNSVVPVQIGTTGDDSDLNDSVIATVQQQHSQHSQHLSAHIDYDYTDRKEQEQRLADGLSSAERELRDLITEQNIAQETFHHAIDSATRPLIQFALEMRELELDFGALQGELVRVGSSTESNLNRLVAYSELCSKYRQCLEETVRRINFKQQEYRDQVHNINTVLRLVQQQENHKRVQFFERVFGKHHTFSSSAVAASAASANAGSSTRSDDSSASSSSSSSSLLSSHRAILYSVLVQNLLPCLDKSQLVPTLDTVRHPDFDHLLPCASSSSPAAGVASTSAATVNHGEAACASVHGSSWVITGDSQIEVKLAAEDEHTGSFRALAASLLSAGHVHREQRQQHASRHESEATGASSAVDDDSDVDDSDAGTISDSDFSDTESMDSLSPVDKTDLLEILDADFQQQLVSKDREIADLRQSLSELSRRMLSNHQSASLLTSGTQEGSTATTATATSMATMTTQEEEADAEKELLTQLQQQQVLIDELQQHLRDHESELLDAETRTNKAEEEKRALLERVELLEQITVECTSKCDSMQFIIESMRHSLAGHEDRDAKLESLSETNSMLEKRIEQVTMQLDAARAENELISKQANNKTELLKEQHTTTLDELAAQHREERELELARLVTDHRQAMDKLREENIEREQFITNEHGHHVFALNDKINKMEKQHQSLEDKFRKVSDLNDKLLQIVDNSSSSNKDSGRLKPNEIKIAVHSFETDDVVVFYRKKHSNGVVSFEIFNQGAPFYYLSPQAVEQLKKLPQWNDLCFVRVQILFTDTHTATTTFNPFKLPLGSAFHVVHPYPFDESKSYNC